VLPRGPDQHVDLDHRRPAVELGRTGRPAAVLRQESVGERLERGQNGAELR
jgi:hypothetical protein